MALVAALVAILVVAAFVLSRAQQAAQLPASSRVHRIDGAGQSARANVYRLESVRRELASPPVHLVSSAVRAPVSGTTPRSRSYRLFSATSRLPTVVTTRFAFNSVQVRDQGELLDRVRTLSAASGPGGQPVSLDVAGHADGIGAVPYNEDLSARRAREVAALLIEAGFSVQAWAYGETCPLAYPDTGSEGEDLPQARQRNRRVVISVAGDRDPTASQHCRGPGQPMVARVELAAQR
ncbi:OmpA family protein [Nocardioides sp.]|uniref:OmpA family protein n=1 Tax=Nocardioides sp. TaxID=35761 RepID=UPI0035AF51ED